MKNETSEVRALVRIIDIPIYRCSIETHRDVLAVARDRFASGYPGDDERSERKRKQLAAWWDEANWYPWRFNEAVGYLSLKAVRGEIVGDLFWREGKRIVGRPKGRLLYAREPLHVAIDPKWRSKDIFEAVCKKIEDLPKYEKRLRSRVIDTEVLGDIGPHLDWKSLVKSTRTEPLKGPRIRLVWPKVKKRAPNQAL